MNAPQPYWSDGQVTLLLGDALDVLRQLPDGSADCCVTSPPYFGLRDYGTEGQIGLEDSPAAYVERLRDVFAEVRRVLADDGTLWLNIGDSYSTRADASAGRSWREDRADVLPGVRNTTSVAPRKSLLGIPWRAAFALQSDGWIWRNVIPWYKPNAMPESVRDRLSNRWEPVVLFAKSARYEFGLDAIREPHTMEQRRRTVTHNYDPPSAQPEHRGLHEIREGLAADGHPLGRNPGDFWEIEPDPFDEWWGIPTTPYPEACPHGLRDYQR